jgi:hypothetical protein
MQEREMNNGACERRGIVWLEHGDRLVRGASAHLRFTTKAEQTLENISAGSSDHFRKIVQELTKGSFDDIVDQAGPDEWGDIPEGEVDEQPGSGPPADREPAAEAEEVHYEEEESPPGPRQGDEEHGGETSQDEKEDG